MQRFYVNGTLTAKKSTLTVACVILSLTQVLTGCGHSDDKVANKEKTSQSNTSQKVDNIDCNAPNATSVIQETTLNQISRQATTNIQQLAQQAGISTADVNFTDIISQMNVAVTNTTAVTGQADQCQANIAVTLPDNVLKKADQIAAGLNQPTIAQNLASKGLNLENNTITAINAGFKLTPSGGSYQVTPSHGSSTSAVLITEVGNLLANSQLAQLIGTTGNTPSLQSANPVSATPVTNETITNAPTTGSSNHLSNPPVIANHAPVIREKTNQTSNTVRSVTKKSTANTEKPPTTVTKKVEKSATIKDDTAKKVVKTTTTTTKTTPPVSSEKPVTKASKPQEKVTKKDTTSAKVDPATKSKPIAKAANDEIKLTIEEKNEKY